jgi:hypothetical protein
LLHAINSTIFEAAGETGSRFPGVSAAFLPLGLLPGPPQATGEPTDSRQSLAICRITVARNDCLLPACPKNRQTYADRYFFNIEAPSVYFGSTMLPRRTRPACVKKK